MAHAVKINDLNILDTVSVTLGTSKKPIVAAVSNIAMHDVVVQRTLTTAVVTLEIPNETTGTPSYVDLHLSGDDTIEVIPPPLFTRIASSDLWVRIIRFLSGRWN